jgi:hypothetical protein
MCGVVALFAVPDGAAKTEPPQGPPPRFCIVQATDPRGGSVSLTSKTIQLILVQEQSVVNDNGVRKTVVNTRLAQQEKQISSTFFVRKGAVYTAEGRKLIEAEAFERLKVGMVVLESTNGDVVDPAYLRTLRPDTLVLIGPPPIPGVPPGGVPPLPSPPKQLPRPQP